MNYYLSTSDQLAGVMCEALARAAGELGMPPGWYHDQVLTKHANGVAVFTRPLKPAQVRILWVLERARPHLLNQAVIAARAKAMKPRTISRHLSELERSGIVRRPRGPKSGYEISSLGLRMLRRSHGEEGS